MQKHIDGIKIATFVIFILVTAAIFLALGYWAGSEGTVCNVSTVLTSKTATNTASVSPTASATADVTANWKTYTNETVGITLKYPDNWTLVNANQGPEVAYFQSAANKKTSVCQETGCDLPSTAKISEFSIAMDLKTYLDQQASAQDPVFTNIKNVKIGNLNGYSADKGPNQLGGGMSYFVQSKVNSDYAIEIWFFTGDSDYSKETTDQILSTFQFTK